MKDPIVETKARTENNEDFYYHHKGGDTRFLMVGDFARISYGGVDELAASLLKTILSKNGMDELGPQILLVQTALEFNNRLLDYRKGFGHTFQCCAVFAVVDGNRLFYLPVGDCRIAVYRSESLILLNETIWREDSGNVLPPVVTKDRKVVRGNEDPPNAALGVEPMSFSVGDVSSFPLQSDDVVVLYSDGVDKFVSPVKLIELIGSGQENEKGRQEVAANILNAVDYARGDDDRTVMLYFGPHISIDEKTRDEMHKLREDNADHLNRISQDNEEKLKVIEDKLAQKLKNLEGLSDQVSKLKDDLSNDLQGIGSQMEANAEKIAAALAAKSGEQGPSIDQKKMVENFAMLDRLVGEAKRVLYPETKGKGKKGTDPIEHLEPEIPRPAEPSTRGDAREGRFLLPEELNITREGVIKVWEGHFALVDESGVHSGANSESTSTEVAYFRFGDDTSGLLTAFHLYLRRFVILMKTDRPIRELQDLIEARKTQFLEKYGNTDFSDAKRKHWPIRDKYARRKVTDRRYKALVDEERALAREVLGSNDDTDSQNSDAGVQYPQPTRWLFDPVIITAGAIILLVIVLFLLYFLGWLPGTGSSGNTANANTAATPKPPGRTLSVGGDGRTIYFTTESGELQKLDERIRVGQEESGRKDVGNAGTASLVDHKSLLEKNNTLFIKHQSVDDISKEQADKSIGFWPVTGEDVAARSDSDKDSICKKLIQRSKSTTKIEELKTLNPSLVCENLKDGEQVLLKKVASTSAPAAPAGRRGRR